MNLKKISLLIEEVIIIIRRPNTILIYCEWKSISEAVDHLNRLLKKLESPLEYQKAICELTTLFAPTGTIQDISFDNGWGDKYLEIAIKFGELVESIQLGKLHPNRF